MTYETDRKYQSKRAIIIIDRLFLICRFRLHQLSTWSNNLSFFRCNGWR